MRGGERRNRKGRDGGRGRKGEERWLKRGRDRKGGGRRRNRKKEERRRRER